MKIIYNSKYNSDGWYGTYTGNHQFRGITRYFGMANQVTEVKIDRNMATTVKIIRENLFMTLTSQDD